MFVFPKKSTMPFLTSRDQHSSELPVTDLTVDTTERVTLNIGGKRFVTSKFSLLNIPTTKLGKLSKSDPSYDSKNDEYFFDRNPKIVQCILDLHRTGDLHLPGNVCSTGVKAELEFWNVPEDYIAECCWKTYSLQNQDLKIAAIIDQQMGQNESQETNQSKPSIREKLWLTMEQPSHSFNAKVWHFVYLSFVMLSITVFCVSTIPSFRLQDSPGSQNVSEIALQPFYILTHTHPLPVLFYLDNVCLVFFTLELPIRFLVCPSKRAFFKRALNILDLFLVTVMITAFGLDLSPAFQRNDETIKTVETSVRLFLGLRVFRIFHLARRYPTIKILYLTVKASLRELLLLLVGLTMAVIVFATFVFLAEAMSFSNSFTSIPYAIWWAIITMTTVGYGDVYPTTVLGYFVGICCALSGLLLLSMPIAIIAANFGAYYSNLTVREERVKREDTRANLKMRNAAEAMKMKLAVKKLFNVTAKSNKTDDISTKLSELTAPITNVNQKNGEVPKAKEVGNGTKLTSRPKKILIQSEMKY